LALKNRDAEGKSTRGGGGKGTGTWVIHTPKKWGLAKKREGSFWQKAVTAVADVKTLGRSDFLKFSMGGGRRKIGRGS